MPSDKKAPVGTMILAVVVFFIIMGLWSMWVGAWFHIGWSLIGG